MTHRAWQVHHCFHAPCDIRQVAVRLRTPGDISIIYYAVSVLRALTWIVHMLRKTRLGVRLNCWLILYDDHLDYQLQVRVRL